MLELFAVRVFRYRGVFTLGLPRVTRKWQSFVTRLARKWLQEQITSACFDLMKVQEKLLRNFMCARHATSQERKKDVT